MEFISKLYAAHDLYVGMYECIGSLSNGVWSRLSRPFPALRPALNTLTTRSTDILYNAMAATVSRTIQVSNLVLRRPMNQTAMRVYRPEVKALFQDAKIEITNLSKDCSIVFDRTIIFSKIPTEEEVQTILEQLFQFKEDAGLLTSPKKKQAADRAIASCTRLHEIHQQIEQKKGEEISSKDLEAFQQSLRQNVLLETSVSATVENIGEMVGGMVVDESGSVIPQRWNPAILLGKTISEYIGRPSGRLVGGAMGVTGIYYLLSKLPLMQFENRRTMIQAGAVLSMLIIEYMHWNPLTNFLEDKAGELSYDLGFYSVSLLFNYIGMYMAGTGESLGSYVRNMTPSMLTYIGANTAFEMIGFEGVVAGVLSFYLSHVAYNFELYQGLFRGTLLAESVELDQIGATVNQQQIQSARRAATSMLLTELSQRMKGISRNQLNAAAAETVNAAHEILPMAKPLISEASQKGIGKLADQFMQGVMLGAQQVHGLYAEGLGLEEIDLKLAKIKNGLQYNEIAFFCRESILFFQFLQTPQMRQLLEDHKREFLSAIAQSRPDNLNGGQGIYVPFEESRRRIFTALIEPFFGDRTEEIVHYFRPILDGEEVDFEKCLPQGMKDYLLNRTNINPELIANLHHVWDPKMHFGVDPTLLMKYIEPLVDEQLDKLYPIVPATSPEDETCSVYMMETLIRAMVIFSKLRIVTGQADLGSVGKLQDRDYLIFLSLMTDFIFDIRFPSQSMIANLQRAGTRRLLQSQFCEK